MAQVEFTQQFNVPYTSGTAFYMQLQSVAGTYIIKGLTCYSTSGITPSSAESLAIISSSNNSGANLRYLFSTNATVAPNVIIPVFSPLNQAILIHGYLGFLALGPSGNMVIQITYSFFPTTNANFSNFSNEYFQINNTTGAAFTGLSATVPTLVKSIVITNPTNMSNVTVTPLLTTVSTTNLAFDNSTTLAPGQSYIYTIPIALMPTDTIQIESVGAANVSVLYSYTQDPYS